MRHQPAARRAAAFTLIELLVVVVILGILMAVAVPTFLRQQSKAQDSRTQQYLTTAFEAIRSGTPNTNNQYPSSTSMVSWIQQAEPELAVQRGDCLTGVESAPVDAVLVGPASTASSLQLCARSQSGNVWKLTASATGVQQLLDGTLVPLTMSGNEITDATRAAKVQGDGLSNDSSTGIWEGTTNYVLNGGLESDATSWFSYTPPGDAAGISTISQDTAHAKFGSAALKITTPGGLTNEGCTSANTAIGIAAPGQTWTGSAWVYSVAGGEKVLFSIEEKEASSYLIAHAQPYTLSRGWNYLSVTGVLTNSSVDRLDVTLRTSTSPQAVTVWLDGAQLEEKSIATPYVETNGTPATRSAARVQVPSALLSTSATGDQGWIAVRISPAWPSGSEPSLNPNLMQWTDGTNNNRIVVYWSKTATKWTLERDTAGVNKSATTSGSFLAGDTVTVIAAWTSSTLSISFDGGPFVSVAAAGGPSGMLSYFDIGQHAAADNWFDGRIFWFACGTGTLSNTDAATINSWGNTDPARSSFSRAAQATMAWNGVGSTASLK